MIYREETIAIMLTVREVADRIEEMDSMEQADLLNIMAEKVKTWGGGSGFQLNAVCQEQMLTKDARTLMSLIGEYSTPF